MKTDFEKITINGDLNIIKDLIKSGEYSVSEIERLSDSKRFKCFFRSGRVHIDHPFCRRSWWIEDNGEEEISTYGADTKKFKIISVIKANI